LSKLATAKIKKKKPRSGKGGAFFAALPQGKIKIERAGNRPTVARKVAPLARLSKTTARGNRFSRLSVGRQLRFAVGWWCACATFNTRPPAVCAVVTEKARAVGAQLKKKKRKKTARKAGRKRGGLLWRSHKKKKKTCFACRLYLPILPTYQQVSA
jgi:hypothetical protein